METIHLILTAVNDAEYDGFGVDRQLKNSFLATLKKGRPPSLSGGVSQ